MSDHVDQLVRTVHKLECIPHNAAWDVIKVAKKVYERVYALPRICALKSPTLYACCIYISCMMNNVCVCKVALCDELGIALSTLKKHEALIQNALMCGAGTATATTTSAVGTKAATATADQV